MNKRFNSRLSVVAGLIMLCMAFASTAALACTALAVSPGATVDGSGVVTQTADSGATPYEFYHFPAKDYAPGTMMDVLNIPQITGGYRMREVAWNPTGNQIPQVEHTYALFGGIFGLMNEKAVGIGESTTSGRRESRNTNGFFDVTNLTYLALERGATAREAIQVMGDLAVKYGYKDGGEMLGVTDGTETWIFEIVGPGPLWSQGDDAPGAYWVAQKVPEGHIAACANNSVINAINFTDSKNFMFGPGIVEYATEVGWYNPATSGTFSWRTHMCNETSIVTCARRVWRAFCLAAPSLASTLNEANLPFSVPVDKKLSIDDINKIQEDYYAGTEFDTSQGITAGPWNNPRRFQGTIRADGVTYGWQRTINVIQSEYTLTVQSRAWLPAEIGGVFWFGFSIPDSTCFVPIYCGITELSASVGDNAGSHLSFTRDSLYWAMSSVTTYMNLKYSYMKQDVEVYRDKYYRSQLRAQAGIDAAALELYKKDPAAAKAFLTKYVNDNIETVKKAWWELLDHLVWKYNMGFVYNAETLRTTSVSYPEAWLRLVISYDDPDHYRS